MDSICTRCRAAGEKLYLKGEKCFTPKCPFTRRPYPPGPTGPGKAKRGGGTNNSRMSDYGRQLKGKQLVKTTYHMRERQMRRFFQIAESTAGQTGVVLATLLERRLDSVVFRAKFAPSRKAARQLVNHGHILVNDKPVSIASFLVSAGDTISPKETPESWTGEELPGWMTAGKKSTITIDHLPTPEEADASLDVGPLIEYYSR